MQASLQKSIRVLCPFFLLIGIGYTSSNPPKRWAFYLCNASQKQDGDNPFLPCLYTEIQKTMKVKGDKKAKLAEAAPETTLVYEKATSWHGFNYIKTNTPEKLANYPNVVTKLIKLVNDMHGHYLRTSQESILFLFLSCHGIRNWRDEPELQLNLYLEDECDRCHGNCEMIEGYSTCKGCHGTGVKTVIVTLKKDTILQIIQGGYEYRNPESGETITSLGVPGGCKVVALFYVCHVGNIFNLPYRYNVESSQFEDVDDSKPATDESSESETESGDKEDSRMCPNCAGVGSTGWLISSIICDLCGGDGRLIGSNSSISGETDAANEIPASGPAILCFSLATKDTVASSMPHLDWANNPYIMMKPDEVLCGVYKVTRALEMPYSNMLRTIQIAQQQAMGRKHIADPALYTNDPGIYNKFRSFRDAMRGNENRSAERQRRDPGYHRKDESFAFGEDMCGKKRHSSERLIND